MAEDPSKTAPPNVTIDYQVPDDVPTHYATNIVVQYSEDVFVLSYFELRPPIILGDDKEKQRASSGIKSIPAVCVARVFVSTANMAKFAEVQSQQVAAANMAKAKKE